MSSVAIHRDVVAIPLILVIEDEPRIASFIARSLTAEGFAVHRASDGEQGLRMALSGRYSLVILDLLLPVLDGGSVLDRLLEERPEQRIMILSAISDVETRVRCFERGAVDYVTKPFSLAELTARIRARLRVPGAAPLERFLRSGSVSLDMVRRVADAGEGPVALTEREFALLHTLMVRNGNVCSRGELLEAVWHLSHDSGSNVVDVYVRRLRSKLGEDTIETVRGAGYRIDAP